jgi:hypothetical protein
MKEKDILKLLKSADLKNPVSELTAQLDKPFQFDFSKKKKSKLISKKKGNPWVAHVREVAKKMNVPYGCAISYAAKSYKTIKSIEESIPEKFDIDIMNALIKEGYAPSKIKPEELQIQKTKLKGTKKKDIGFNISKITPKMLTDVKLKKTQIPIRKLDRDLSITEEKKSSILDIDINDTRDTQIAKKIYQKSLDPYIVERILDRGNILDAFYLYLHTKCIVHSEFITEDDVDKPNRLIFLIMSSDNGMKAVAHCFGIENFKDNFKDNDYYFQNVIGEVGYPLYPNTIMNIMKDIRTMKHNIFISDTMKIFKSGRGLMRTLGFDNIKGLNRGKINKIISAVNKTNITSYPNAISNLINLKNKQGFSIQEYIDTENDDI